MRLIELPRIWTILIDIIAWFIIHMAVVNILLRIPDKYFQSSGWPYRQRRWEKKGHIYQKLFKINKWKKYLPDGAEWFNNNGFPKKHLKDRSVEYLSAFRTETCRGELTHWIIIFFAPFFFLWNHFFVGWIMITYALIENIPLIMTQRYNRHRLERVLSLKHLPLEI